MKRSKVHVIQVIRLCVQILFFAGLALSLIPGFMSIWPATLIIVFFISAFAGNFYCGWLCPFGSLQEWLGRLGSLFVKRKLHMPPKAQRILKYARYGLYGLLLANASLGIFGEFSQTSAFNANSHFLSVAGAGSIERLQRVLSVPIAIYLIAYLAAALFFDRPFCNYFCPDGVKYGLLSFMRVFTVRRDASKCVGCNKCNCACPMQIDVAACGNLRHANCINCMRCVTACPVDKALTYGLCLLHNAEKDTVEQYRSKEAPSC